MSAELECIKVRVPGFWSTGIELVPASTAISHAFTSGAEGTVCQCRRVKIGPVPISHGRWQMPDELPAPVDDSVLESRVPELNPWRDVAVLALHSHKVDTPCDETCSVYEKGTP